MKQLFITFLAFCSCLAYSTSSFAETWYIRADGGSRFVPSIAAGQCDGKGDAAYPGTGVNQHCAFNDYRSLWDDRNSYGSTSWVIAGGDTVILDNTKQWRVGFDQGTSANDQWCFGGNGTFGCSNPTIPSGTATQHTRILGRNYASCSIGNAPNPQAMTQIFGGFGVYTPLNLQGAQFVDVQCLDITRHSQCITHGVPAYPSTCGHDGPVDDYDSDGIVTDTNTHDLLLQDLWVHGHTDRGIIGPIGGVVTANRVDIAYNGMAGWDFDNGSGTASVNATLNLINSTIEWNGCNQEYPIVSKFPAISCYSQSTGGYGDGIGTPAGMGMNVNIDHDVFRYNTQDGEDFGHITSPSTLSITNSLSYGNNGGQFKWGPGFTNVNFTNNLVVGNCLRMSQSIPGAPSTFNANLSDFCRANDALSFNFFQNATALFANNTVVSYSPTTFDMACNDANSCSGVVFTFTNNLIRTYDNPTTYNMGGQRGGPGGFCGAYCNGSQRPIGTFNRSNNIFYGFRGSCVANTPQGAATAGTATGESCVDAAFVNEPETFVDETSLDSYNFNLASNSPAVGAGLAVAGTPNDFNGQIRPARPSIGAIEFAPAIAALPIVTPAAPLAPPAMPNAGAPPSYPTPGVPNIAGSGNSQTTGTTIMLAFSTPHATAHQIVKLLVTVAPNAGTSAPTGTVTFSIGKMIVGPVRLTNGALAMTVPSIMEHMVITGRYSGDKTYFASSSTLAAE